MMRDNSQQAIIQFEKALTFNRSFWLARFYLAKLLLTLDPEKARNEIRRCLEDILNYLEREDDTYRFLMEGFHAKYFSMICRKWLVKLTDKGIVRE
jgi:hypothetical protein